MAENFSDLTTLETYIRQTIQKAEPSIDVSPGSPIDTVFITPLITRLGPDPYDTPVEDFILGRLQTEFPDLVIQEGDPLYDYGVKIMRILLEPFRRQIRQVSNNQSLADASTLALEEAENLGANYFVNRKVGGYSVGVARLYYSSPQYSIITPSNPVFTSSDLKFYPVENQAITAELMLFNVEGNLYYFDIVVRAQTQGKEYDIPSYSLVGIEGVSAVVKVSNRAKFEEGDDAETTEQFIERVENSLTEKSLVTIKGINARVIEIFESIKSIQVIGYGDIEMERDKLTGSTAPVSYALGMVSVTAPNLDHLDLGAWISDGNPAHVDFEDIGVLVGDRITVYNTSTSLKYEVEVTEISSATLVVYPALVAMTTGIASFGRSPGVLRISNIPGGILEPNTPFGEIEIADDVVHIGGMLDVFIRAGFPQQRDTTLESIRDDVPLHFGLDLESFGEDDDELINITDKISTQARVPSTDIWGNTLTNRTDVLIRVDVLDTGKYCTPWYPTSRDVGRYIQLIGTNEYGTFEIITVDDMELDGTTLAVRIGIDTLNLDSGATITDLTASATYTQSFRIREKVSVHDRVRDRDNSRVPALYTRGAGADFSAIGAVIGDSIVVETGDDAGTYSIRKILSSIGSSDTLIMDRDLSKTLTPSGLGDHSGLRYRVADALDIDLIEPKITKIPLGEIFTGTDLNTVAGSDSISVSGGDTNFLLAGVTVGDTLEILEGDNQGKYGILDVTSGTALRLNAILKTTISQVRFSVYRAFSGTTRPLVRVRSIELLDSSSHSTGITFPYGNNIDARILGKLSNRDAGNEVESYTGEVTNTTTLYDAEVDFITAGVLPGWRISVFSGNNVGDYIIEEVFDLHTLYVYSETAGGNEFRVNESGIYYQVGMPSTGYLRLYFLEPTSVEIITGLLGGRVTTEDTAKTYLFSEAEGYLKLPEASSDEETPRDLRIARSLYSSTTFLTNLEITDVNRPDLYGMELEVGDEFEINEWIPFRCSSAHSSEVFPKMYKTGPTFAGVAGTASGIHTLAGSNRIRVADNSVVDFLAMEAIDGIVGQYLIIESGPDAGRYIIEEVIDAKTLRLNAVMTGTTENYWKETSAISNPLDLRDATLTLVGTKTELQDPTDGGASGIGTQIGHYITIFEAKNKEIEGTYEITAVDVPNYKVTLDFAVGGAVTAGKFSWIRTALKENVEYKFNIYRRIPAKYTVTEVAAKEVDKVALSNTGETLGASPPYIRLQDLVGSPFASVEKGDRLEIMFGSNVGVYTIETVVNSNNVDVYTSKPFAVKENKQFYRVWGGVHGQRRTARVGSTVKPVPFGVDCPYIIRRPKVFRIPSTEMKNSFDGTLYYVDIPIESEGAGDALNLEIATRMLVKSGMSVDGYRYSALNNTLTFSPYERVSLNLTRRFLPTGNSDSPANTTEVSGRNLKVTYDTSSIAGLVNDLMRSDAERPVNANPIGRHFLPSYLFTTLEYSGGLPAATVGPEIEDYVNNLQSATELEISDLEAFLTRRGATYVKHPIELVSVTHDIDRNLIVDRSFDKIGGTVVPFEGTARISSFFARMGEGLNITRK